MQNRVIVAKKGGAQRLKFTAVFLLLKFFLFFNLVGVGVAEMRQHGSHVHGIADLNIAQEGENLILELKSPAANIVGFEHAPETDKQKQAVKDAIALLENGEKLFALPKKAGCSLHDAHVENDMMVEHDEHHSHDHKHSDEHKHADKHEDKHKDTHAKHSDDDHKEDGHAEHSEFMATYHFECTSPTMLKNIDVLLFANFSGLEELHVQLLTPKRQTAAKLSPKKHLIDLD